MLSYERRIMRYNFLVSNVFQGKPTLILDCIYSFFLCHEVSHSTTYKRDNCEFAMSVFGALWTRNLYF